MIEASSLSARGGRGNLPAAIYYEEADSVEYVRRDVPTLNRRIDRTLTLVFDLETRDLLGFRVKGFRHFYNRHLRPTIGYEEEKFIKLITVLETLICEMGNEIIAEPQRASAYQAARSIADEDKVHLADFPNVA